MYVSQYSLLYTTENVLPIIPSLYPGVTNIIFLEESTVRMPDVL